MLLHHTRTVLGSGENSPAQGIVVPLDLPEVQIFGQEIQPNGKIEVHVIAHTSGDTCPNCGTFSEKIHDIRGRVKRDIFLRSYQVRLILYKRRFRCVLCKKTFTEKDGICGRYRRTTKRFREDLAYQSMKNTIAQVAESCEVGPRFVQECFESLIQEKYAEKGRSLDETAKLPTPQYLGIDEFARRKGHCYDTILCDLENHIVLEVCEGRKLEEVQQLLNRLSDPEKVEAVSMDMSASFRPAVQSCLPHAVIVVDHFHVMQHLMKAFKKIVSSFAHKIEGMIILKGKQHLFLRAQEDLTEEQVQDRKKIGARLPLLEEAWQFKEAFRSWYATATPETAEQELDTWIKSIQESSFTHLQKALSIFKNWKKEILAFFQFRITNGFVEGKNNRTKAMMRQGYGYRNRHHLRFRIFAGDAV
jgi:transposase